MAAAATALPFDPAQLVNFAEPWDANRVQMLDHMITLMYSNQAHRELANQVLTQVRDHPDSWHVVDTVLATSQSADTKFFALKLLEAVISTRWRVLPAEQRTGIKNYVVQLVIKISSDEQFVVTQKHFLAKLNQTLIQIVKQEWPDAWANFIPDICGASKTSQSLCENNLRILNLLSEEVFTFGSSHMTSKKVAGLKDSLNTQFATIYELCDFVFKSHIQSPGSIKASLLETTLSTLAKFLEWIPVHYIFETDLIQTLLMHFWDPPEYRIECVKCLNEIACLHEGVQQYQPQLIRCFQGVVEKIQQLPQHVPETYMSMNGAQRHFWEVFHNQIALFLIGFLHHNMAVMEAQHVYMNHAIIYLARITTTPNEETFKICVEFWQTFSARLYLDEQMHKQHAAKMSQQQRASPLLLDPAAGRQAQQEHVSEKLQRYQQVLTEVCHTLISKMAKPQEVTIKENEEGHIVRAEEEDTDELALYRLMREALIYFTNLNPTEMESIMLSRLTQECLSEGTAANWTPTLLNRLCWAIGSISGAMQERDEKRFVCSVIKDLLSLCEMKRGKENKGVVAANMMYVVGQYPRFLRAHWKFLKVVICKLFEFMRETIPGIQEMAVETFLKICQKCKKKLAIKQKGEPMTFVEAMLPKMYEDICDLEHLHLCTFFEGMGHMVSAATLPDERERLVSEIMSMWNNKWNALLQQLNAAGEQQFSNQHQVLREISLVLRVNERMVSAAGASCHRQLERIYLDMLKIYKVCSDFISAGTAQQGMQIMGHTSVKLMRNVKRDTLRLVQVFVDVAAGDGAAVTAEAGLSPQQIAQKFVPPLLEPVLADYRSNLPQARDAEVLDLLATLATRLSESISQEVTKIFEMVFECTLDMIKGDFQSFPDHRSKFYNLLKAINAHCFQSLFFLSEAQLKLYVDSLIWAMKHEQPQVADSGLQILEQFLARVLAGPPQVRSSFFAQYYFTLMQDILVVLTDTLHKAGFKLQQAILLQLINIVDAGLINEVAPKQRVMEYLFGVINKAFPTLHRSQVEIFVLNCFNKCRAPADFQQHIRDFLIEMREWGSHEDAYYESERKEACLQAQVADVQFRLQVPGLVPQYDPARAAIEADMDDI